MPLLQSSSDRSKNSRISLGESHNSTYYVCKSPENVKPNKGELTCSSSEKSSVGKLMKNSVMTQIDRCQSNESNNRHVVDKTLQLPQFLTCARTNWCTPEATNDKQCQKYERERPTNDRQRLNTERERLTNDRQKQTNDRQRPNIETERPANDRRRPHTERDRPTKDRQRPTNDQHRSTNDRPKSIKNSYGSSNNNPQPMKDRRNSTNFRPVLSDDRLKPSNSSDGPLTASSGTSGYYSSGGASELESCPSIDSVETSVVVMENKPIVVKHVQSADDFTSKMKQEVSKFKRKNMSKVAYTNSGNCCEHNLLNIDGIAGVQNENLVKTNEFYVNWCNTNYNDNDLFNINMEENKFNVDMKNEINTFKFDKAKNNNFQGETTVNNRSHMETIDNNPFSVETMNINKYEKINDNELNVRTKDDNRLANDTTDEYTFDDEIIDNYSSERSEMESQYLSNIKEVRASPTAQLEEFQCYSQPPNIFEDLHRANLSFSGCGFLGIYHVGVAACLRRLAPQLTKTCSAGTSAGALAAALMICNSDLGKLTAYVYNEEL